MLKLGNFLICIMKKVFERRVCAPQARTQDHFYFSLLHRTQQQGATKWVFMSCLLLALHYHLLSCHDSLKLQNNILSFFNVRTFNLTYALIVRTFNLTYALIVRTFNLVAKVHLKFKNIFMYCEHFIKLRTGR